MPKAKKQRRVKRIDDTKKTSHRSTKPTKDQEMPAAKEARVVAKKILSALEKEYVKKANKEKAAWYKTMWTKNQYDFYGLSFPIRRIEDEKVLKNYSNMDRTTLVELLKLSWDKPQREFQYFSFDVASKYLDVLTGSDDDTCRQTVEDVKWMLEHKKSYWDTVDWIAPGGTLAQRKPDILNPVLDEWILDENLWLRRSAIIHQLYYKEKTDSERLFRYCLQCGLEDEFFIKRAIGWALRQYFRTNPSGVKTFVAKNKHKLSALSVKEALKHAKK